MTMFRWRSHEAVTLRYGCMTFIFEGVLTSSVSYAILDFVTNIYKTFQGQFSFV